MPKHGKKTQKYAGGNPKKLRLTARFEDALKALLATNPPQPSKRRGKKIQKS